MPPLASLAIWVFQLGAVKLDLKAMMASKGKIVSGLTGGIDHLFKKNKITRLTGSAMLKGDGIVEVASGKKKEQLQGRKNPDCDRLRANLAAKCGDR